MMMGAKRNATDPKVSVCEYAHMVVCCMLDGMYSQVLCVFLR